MQIVKAEAVVYEGLNPSVTALQKAVNTAEGFGWGLQPTIFPPMGAGRKKILGKK